MHLFRAIMNMQNHEFIKLKRQAIDLLNSQQSCHFYFKEKWVRNYEIRKLQRGCSKAFFLVYGISQGGISPSGGKELGRGQKIE